MYNLGMGLLGKVFPPLRAKANTARLTGRAVSSFGLNLSGHAELPLRAFGPVFDIRNTLVPHPRQTLDGIQAQNLFQIAGSAIVAMVLEMREMSGKIG